MSRRASLTLIGAGLAVFVLVLTWLLTFHVGVFARADVNILTGFLDLRRPAVKPVASFVAKLCNPQPYGYLVAVPILLALARRRPAVALMLGAIVLGANGTTQLLKPLLAEPRVAIPGGLPIIAASWPSGHATAAMSLALCAVIAVPARLRPTFAALGAAFAAAVSYSFLTLGWHYPSDVFGGFLVAAAWTLLGAGTLFALEARRGRSARSGPLRGPTLGEALRAPGAAALGVVALGALIALARPRAVLSYADAHTTFVVGAAAIGVLSLTLATGLMLALRR